MRLIDAEAMRENLLWCKEQSGSYDDHWDDVIERLDVQPTVGGWISVKDRLPEDERFVLVCNDDGKMMVAQYIAETVQWQYRYIAYDVDVWDDDENGPVCWWMSLPPEPPKEETSDKT